MFFLKKPRTSSRDRTYQKDTFYKLKWTNMLFAKVSSSNNNQHHRAPTRNKTQHTTRTMHAHQTHVTQAQAQAQTQTQTQAGRLTRTRAHTYTRTNTHDTYNTLTDTQAHTDRHNTRMCMHIVFNTHCFNQLPTAPSSWKREAHQFADCCVWRQRW